jgi:hypothetical protein
MKVKLKCFSIDLDRKLLNYKDEISDESVKIKIELQGYCNILNKRRALVDVIKLKIGRYRIFTSIVLYSTYKIESFLVLPSTLPLFHIKSKNILKKENLKIYKRIALVHYQLEMVKKSFFICE